MCSIFKIFFFFFLRESFNLQRPLLMIALYHQTKTPTSFQCRWGLNPRSLIQPSETLPVELTGTHYIQELGPFSTVSFFKKSSLLSSCVLKIFNIKKKKTNKFRGLQIPRGFCRFEFELLAWPQNQRYRKEQGKGEIKNQSVENKKIRSTTSLKVRNYTPFFFFFWISNPLIKIVLFKETTRKNNNFSQCFFFFFDK